MYRRPTSIAAAAPTRRRRPMANASARSSKRKLPSSAAAMSSPSSPSRSSGPRSARGRRGPGVFRRMREICDRHGILLILDEVMCGMGRTGTLHACEQEGISPDLMAIAKGLGGGFAPIGALLMQDKIFDAVAEGSGAFQHSHTYM